MTEAQKKFVIQLAEQTRSHEDWLALVRFGLNQLLIDQDVLLLVITDEALRENAKRPKALPLSEEIARIMTELELRFAMVSPNRHANAS